MLSKRWWKFSLIVALLGFAVSAYLTYNHYYTLFMGINAKSACNVSQYFNCDMVLNSRFSKLWFIPLAGLGLLFYLYVLGALIYAKIEEAKSASTLKLPFILSIFAVLGSMALAYESTVHIQSFCLYCLSLYIINLLLMIGLWALVRNPAARGDSSWGKKFIYAASIFVVGMAIFYGVDRKFNRSPSQADLDQAFQAFFAQTPVEFNTEGKPYWGNPNAKIVLVEFGDYECPVCKRAAFSLKPILADFQNKIKLVFMNYPLDRACNPEMPRDLHMNACKVAYASYCAHKQEKFLEFNDEAYSQQPKYSDKNLENIARSAGLDLAQFNECIKSDEAKNYIKSDLEQGAKAQIQGTPSLFVNGRPLPPYFLLDPASTFAWKQLLERLEAQAGTP